MIWEKYKIMPKISQKIRNASGKLLVTSEIIPLTLGKIVPPRGGRLSPRGKLAPPRGENAKITVKKRKISLKYKEIDVKSEYAPVWRASFVGKT
ncbi:MAG: hypothetical protein WC794_02395 [Candidatus Doudnabacteria bacterium]